LLHAYVSRLDIPDRYQTIECPNTGNSAKPQNGSLKRDGTGQIKNMISIRERPAAVEDRAVPGHWEGDLLGGSKNSYIATLVERHTRYVMLAKVKSKDTESVVSALIKQAKKRPMSYTSR